MSEVFLLTPTFSMGWRDKVTWQDVVLGQCFNFFVVMFCFKWVKNYGVACLGLMMAHAMVASSIQSAPPTEMVEPGPEFGPRFATIPLGVGPTMDVAVHQGRVYAIGKGKLTIFEDALVEKVKPLGTLTGLGNTRQIAVEGDHAYITSREDGMFVVNVKNPAQPRLAALDLSNPREPKLLSQLKLAGHPGRAKSMKGHWVLPAGREGLLLWKLPSP